MVTQTQLCTQAGDRYPGGWVSEAFVVVPISPNEHKIMLWHPGSERFLEASRGFRV